MRRVAKFREQTQKIDAAGGTTDKEARLCAAYALIQQIDDMMETNVTVCETLTELKTVADEVLKDVQELED